MSGQKSILLTTPDGTQRHAGEESAAGADNITGNSSIQFDSDTIENSRGRSKKRSANGGISRANVSRSRSRASLRIKEEECLKWTILRRDPSMRLYKGKKKDRQKETGVGSNNSNGEDDNEEEEVEEEEEDDDDESSEESDEEQVSDIENDLEIDEEFQYDLGMKVLPNYCMSINDVIESSTKWISEYQKNENEPADVETLEGGYMRAIKLIHKGNAQDKKGQCYILYTDLTNESHYAMLYVVGAVLNDGDTLYVVHWENSDIKGSSSKLLQNVATAEARIRHLLDCSGAVLSNIDAVVLSLTHPYPKHLLNEMIYGLKPVALCCSLSVVLSASGLQNFVCSIPMLVIRKKLKRSRRKGINE